MSDPPPDTMRMGDVFRFLIGDRNAILRIAATPWALLVGAVLVMSAGIARNYDHLDLLHDWEWIYGPFAASVVTSLFVFIWVHSGIGLHAVRTARSDYLTFLSLVWLTAPCAWLYGIPVERFTDIYTATQWNIGFLVAVSLWRVFLMVRAVRVLSGAPWPRVTLLILAPASIEMFFGSTVKSMSLVGVMGGVRLPPHNRLLLEASHMTTALSFWVCILSIVGLFLFRGKATNALSRLKARFPVKAAILAAACFGVWILAAFPGYKQVHNRQVLRSLIRQQRYAEAVAFASIRQREDFSTIHYLPPAPDEYQYSFPIECLDHLKPDSPVWLREEWTANAIEFFKAYPVILRYKIKDEYPVVYAGLWKYAEELKAKTSLDRDEQNWLKSFEDLKDAEPPKQEP